MEVTSVPCFLCLKIREHTQKNTRIEKRESREPHIHSPKNPITDPAVESAAVLSIRPAA